MILEQVPVLMENQVDDKLECVEHQWWFREWQNHAKVLQPHPHFPERKADLLESRKIYGASRRVLGQDSPGCPCTEGPSIQTPLQGLRLTPSVMQSPVLMDCWPSTERVTTLQCLALEAHQGERGAHSGPMAVHWREAQSLGVSTLLAFDTFFNTLFLHKSWVKCKTTS